MNIYVSKTCQKIRIFESCFGLSSSYPSDFICIEPFYNFCTFCLSFGPLRGKGQIKIFNMPWLSKIVADKWYPTWFERFCFLGFHWARRTRHREITWFDPLMRWTRHSIVFQAQGPTSFWHLFLESLKSYREKSNQSVLGWILTWGEKRKASKNLCYFFSTKNRQAHVEPLET